MVDAAFFDESREQSQIKARIVAKYFFAWVHVIKKFSPRIAYIDLFAGPGRYEDGTTSTPILILTKAIEDEHMRGALVTLFNDKDGANVGKLEKAISELPGIEKLTHKPQVSNEIVGEAIAEKFAVLKLVPTFFFVDPWGYKGLSLRLINSVLRNWGCDCVFFFNYNRVNMGLNNEAVREHMNALFGEKRADGLRADLPGLNPAERESLIVEELASSLREMGATFVLPFAFKNEKGTRTTHHLIFASKDFKGYEIMKEIMAKESSEVNQGVPTFEYSPASEKFPTLFELLRPLDDLGNMLAKDFSDQTISMYNVYRSHSVGRPFLKTNYKRVLAAMEADGRITASPPADKRPKRKGEVTFGDGVMVTFAKLK
jgi:three-Cys-motif partner protein